MPDTVTYEILEVKSFNEDGSNFIYRLACNLNVNAVPMPIQYVAPIGEPDSSFDAKIKTDLAARGLYVSEVPPA